MSKDSYKVVRKYLKEADFEILTLKIPAEELEDKLTYLANEKGHISRSLYEDFVIATCIANVNQLLYHLSQHLASPPELIIKVRDEIMDVILEVNPLLDPKNLVINRNSVVKLKDGRVKKGEKLLTKNKSWELSYYDELVSVTKELNDKLKQDDTKKLPPKQLKSKGELKDLDSLEYVVTQKWWKRIGKYVKIKQYTAEDVESILQHRFFHNRMSFETFIVSVCVDEFEELFELLDDLGIPQRVAPPILMHELYELCRTCNEFLTFKNAQELAGADDDSTESRQCSGLKGAQTAGSLKKLLNKKEKRLFKDVPKEDILNIADNMKVFLIGQDEAVDTVADAIQRASVGLKDPEKPIGSFIFAGRTGVGKTLGSKVLADELIKGSKNNIINVDCSEYTADHEYSKLIGAPAGYVGHEQGGMLTNAIQKNPFTVVVFDEIEKASYKVHQLLLQILEEGRLTDGKGKQVSFKEAVIVMTSNVGVKELESISKSIGFGDANVLTEKKKNVALKEALKKKFKPEFLNRIGAIVNFKTLLKKDYMKIIDIELYKLNENLKNNDSEYKNITLEFGKKIREFIYKKGINEEYGARPLKRCIEKEVSTPLARKLLGEEVELDGKVTISAEKGKAIFEVKKKVDNPPFYISNDYQNLMAKTLGEKE